MQRRQRTHGLLGTAAAAVLLAMTLGLAGCGSDGDDGAQGPPGQPGEPGEPGAPAPAPPGDTTSLSVTVTDAYVEDGRPVVEFEIADARGLAVDVPPANLEFSVARLVQKGQIETWQSYLTTASTPGAPRTGNFARLQARSVRGNDANGSLEVDGSRYTFRYPVNVSEVPDEYARGVEPVTAADWVDESQIDLRRFVVLLRPVDGQWAAAYDFEDAGPGESKRSIATETCNSCHDNLTAHGSTPAGLGNRVGVETCTNCHNQFTFNSFTPTATASDMTYLGHELHSGGGLMGQETFLRPQWSGVGFPRDIKTCSSCHNSAHADGADRAFTQASPEACLSCHDSVVPSAGTNHPNVGGLACSTCHGPDGLDIAESHIDPARQFARDGDLRYVIDSVARTGDELTVVWGLEYAGSRVTAGADGWGFNALLKVGDLQTDFVHSVLPASQTAIRRPGQPLELSNTQAFAGTIVDDGTYTTVVDLTGNGLDDNLYVTLGGNVSNSTAALPALVASNAVKTTQEARRTVVSNEACNTCHEDRFGVFSKHGGSRHNDVQQCVLCHNTNTTDWQRRQRVANPDATPPVPAQSPPPVGELTDEMPSNLMTMVHKLHSADPDYTLPSNDPLVWSYWADLRYPTTTANCNQCHVGDSYYPVDRALEPRGDSRVTAGNMDIDTHLKVSQGMAACSSCHSDPVAMAHMMQNGGVTNETQLDIDASYFETCATCHGPGRTADVKTVHGLK
jgi:OmcA/MtrC family decaheme c-type cytochrome